MPNLLTTEQAAQRLGITPGRVRQLARAGGYGQRFGAAWAFSEDDLRTLAVIYDESPSVLTEQLITWGVLNPDARRAAEQQEQLR